MTLVHRSLLPVALEAAAIARDLMRTLAPGILTAKGDRDMASETDFAVERAVREHLHDKSPDVAILGEEEGVTGDEKSDLLWAIDPVDGTANFVRGLPLCGFSLGLIHHGHPVLGVIDLPFLNVRYHAVQDGGAYLGDRRLHASTTSDLRSALVSTGDYAVGRGAEEKNRLRLALNERLAANVQRVRMLGSAAIDLAWVAEGKLDACLIMSNKPWDTAAGVIIAREAGATVIDKDGTDHTLHSTATIATAPALAKDIATLVRETSEALTHPA
jgi:myo-inositol-1(or 4)-monophosphatase